MFEIVEKLIHKGLFCLEAEKAHDLAIKLLNSEITRKFIISDEIRDDSLNVNLFDLHFKNPVGLAAGFDKNAACLRSLSKFGFGFLEAGTVTVLPQKGNAKPRLFRLVEDKAIINSLGFNNKGANTFERNIEKSTNYCHKRNVKIGINIGKNKESKSNIDDYITLLNRFYEIADYITVNISSPNTPGLRDIQHKENFENLILSIAERKNELEAKTSKKTPVLVKIAPDNDMEQLEWIAENVLKHKIDGVILTNTTIALRDSLKSINRKDFGGLSGAPLFDLSTNTLREFYKITKGQVPLIGVGGISNTEEAIMKIRNGASLVQIYTAFIYNSFRLVSEINKGILLYLQNNGIKNIQELTGIDVK